MLAMTLPRVGRYVRSLPVWVIEGFTAGIAVAMWTETPSPLVELP
jgi:MFS superfamily sulfate permease-like transporter